MTMAPFGRLTCAAELHVRAFQRLLDSIDFRRPLAHQSGAIARQFAQLALRPILHEARLQQAMARQIRDPLTIFDIGLATGHLLDVLRVGEHQREALFKEI